MTADFPDACAEVKTSEQAVAEHALCHARWLLLSPEQAAGTTFHAWTAHLR